MKSNLKLLKIYIKLQLILHSVVDKINFNVSYLDVFNVVPLSYVYFEKRQFNVSQIDFKNE